MEVSFFKKILIPQKVENWLTIGPTFLHSLLRLVNGAGKPNIFA
jgi:hypothetical protein